ncbi:MAG: AraC family transcriptional regulator [Bacteroidota bacterium]
MSKPKTFLQKAEQIVLQNLSDFNFGVHELSTMLHLSSSQTYRKIKAQTGKSPSLFISHIRLSLAYDLLQESDLSITQIAYRVGFADVTYFSHSFRDFFGKTPTQVRRDAG